MEMDSSRSNNSNYGWGTPKGGSDTYLSNEEFVKRLREDKLEFSNEIKDWNEEYNVFIENEETTNILQGKPSLKDMGLNTEEEKVAAVDVQSKMLELERMPLEKLVDYVNQTTFE